MDARSNKFLLLILSNSVHVAIEYDSGVLEVLQWVVMNFQTAFD